MSVDFEAFHRIKAGKKVTILVYAGKNSKGEHNYVERTGRAMLRGPAGWVLYMEGTSGARPEIADSTNVVRVN